MTHDWKPQRFIALRRSFAASFIVSLGMGASATWPARAQASPALAQKYACVACHQPAVRVVGPSWKDIRARYGEGEATAAQ
jgi:cytochrome c